MDENLKCEYFPVVLFIVLHKLALTFESVDEVLQCDYSNEATEQHFPLIGAVYCAAKGDLNF